MGMNVRRRGGRKRKGKHAPHAGHLEEKMVFKMPEKNIEKEDKDLKKNKKIRWGKVDTQNIANPLQASEEVFSDSVLVWHTVSSWPIPWSWRICLHNMQTWQCQNILLVGLCFAGLIV